MARSVSSLSDAVSVTHLHNISFYDDDGDYSYYDFSEFIEDIRNVVAEKYPSFEAVDKWEGREDHIILENGSAIIAVSEYCGLIAISLAPKDGGEGYYESYDKVHARNANWTGRIANNFDAHLIKRYPNNALNKIGVASNGEAFFSPVNRPEGVVTSKEGVLACF